MKTRQAAFESAQVDLNRTTIHAPIDGVVITRKVEAGQTVAAAMTTPPLFTIANDLHKMQIEAAVSEADIGGVEEGQKVQFTVDAFPGRIFEGSVNQVRYAPSTNQNVVTYTSVVEVDNKDLKLRPGMTANARFITAERKNVLKLPLAAVRFRPARWGHAYRGHQCPYRKGRLGGSGHRGWSVRRSASHALDERETSAYRGRAHCLRVSAESGAKAEIRKGRG